MAGPGEPRVFGRGTGWTPKRRPLTIPHMPTSSRIPSLHRAALLLLAAGVVAMPFSRASADAPPTLPTPLTPPTPPTKPAAEDPDDLAEMLVHLKDGRRISGVVSKQNAEEIVLVIAGIPTRFPTADVERFEVLPSLFERYRQLREAVGDDADQIVKLAEWLQTREKYEWAYAEVQRALKADPSHPQALKLRTLLEQQIQLKAKRQAKPKPEEDDGPEVPKPGPLPRIDFPLLSQEQVDLMKVYEIDLATNPRLLIPRETIAKVLEAYSAHPLVPITREGREAIFRKGPADVLDLMFRLQAREFYKDVQVLDPPKPMQLFRDQVARTWLLNSCATTQCHGGMEAGRLILFNRRANAERSLYTNFLILSRFRTADGTPLLDFESPERSLLLQLGLPKGRSRLPHPPVFRGVGSRDAFKPVFQTDEDRAFKSGVEWIKSLYKPRPEYPIVYESLRPLVVAPRGKAPQPDFAPPPPQPAPAAPAPASAPTPDAPAPSAPGPDAVDAPEPTAPSTGGTPRQPPR